VGIAIWLPAQSFHKWAIITHLGHAILLCIESKTKNIEHRKCDTKITVMTEQQFPPTLVKFPKYFLVGLLQFQMFFQNLQLSEGDLGGLL
jgi:hypothetical protein